MTPQINPLLIHVTPKQKKDLLGMYQDYIYFSRGLEFIFNCGGSTGLAGKFMERVSWHSKWDMPWHFNFTDNYENKDYINFVSGNYTETPRYSYISLYHTHKEQDVSLPKISAYPEVYDYCAIDLDLPCLVERYGITCPANQKLKDATFLVDGELKVNYIGKKFADTPVFEALSDEIFQKEFRVLLNLTDFCNRHKYEMVADTTQGSVFKPMMTKILAAESIAEYENKVLDLLGSSADKTLEILRTVYTDKDVKTIWQKAERAGLISSAENMNDYLNIRQLIRHQWDSLDNTGRFSFGLNPQNEQYRSDYLTSYHKFFDLPLVERIKEYQKVAQNLQTMLKILYPEFITREHGETNSKFILRIKQWLHKNPDKHPMINGNYPLKSEKNTSLVNNLKKIAPEVTVIDSLTEKELDNVERENAYFNRNAYLRAYSRLISNFVIYTLANGLNVHPKEIFDYFLKKNVLSEAERERWQKYRLLRNNLSHNHINQQLHDELKEVLLGTFNEDYAKLKNFMYDNIPQLVRVSGDIFTAEQKDGTVLRLDMHKNIILDHTDKNGKSLLKTPSSNTVKKHYPVKVNTWNNEVIDCRFDNGMTINLDRKKISFPDGTRLYFDAENYNVFRFENGNKIFTDKTFVVTKYQERGRFAPLGRNEMFMAAPKHKIKTDSRSRIVESSLICENGQRLITKLNYDRNGAVITLADGTKINTTDTGFSVSHNNIKLSNETISAFVRSYGDTEPMTPPFSR